MRERLQPAPVEVLDEFSRVSEQLQVEFDHPNYPGQRSVDDYFDALGLQTSPSIVIPNNKSAYSTIVGILSASKYPEMTVLDMFAGDQDFNDLGRIANVSVEAYGLNILTDIQKEIATQYGENCAREMTHETYAHENMHSSFHHMREFFVEKKAGKVTKIFTSSPMLNTNYQIWGENMEDNLPSWIDESFASYISGFATRSQSNDPGIFVKEEGLEYWFSSKYAFHSERFPDQPGWGYGAFAGQALEFIDEKFSNVIERGLAVARGEVDAIEYRNDMAAKVGPELFRLMFTRQPYDTWPKIYKMVQELEL